eukprot:scaffold34478_cov55-Attheya_sp.AAC.1
MSLRLGVPEGKAGGSATPGVTEYDGPISTLERQYGQCRVLRQGRGRGGAQGASSGSAARSRVWIVFSDSLRCRKHALGRDGGPL